MPRETILILGGTREAAELAARLVTENPRARVITSLAGRTREPAPLAGETRIGGFGGVDGLAAYLHDQGVTRLIDATHPFAAAISANAEAAAALTGVPLQTVSRPPWSRQAGDRWQEFPNLMAARDAIPVGARVLLALGSQHIAPFATRADVHFVVRMFDPPTEPLPLVDHELVLGKPGATASDERALLTAHEITHVLCRNSGGPGAYAKIEAARELDLPVIMIGRG